MVAVLAGLFLLAPLSFAKEASRQWEVINPEGVVQITPMQVTPHPSTLEGKTVLLRWNGKHNGDLFLERIGELLTERIKDIKIVKSWEVAIETAEISQSDGVSKKWADKLASYKPDLVIGSQGD